MTSSPSSDNLVVVACMCGATLKVPNALKGSRVKCMRCGAMARVSSTAKASTQATKGNPYRPKSQSRANVNASLAGGMAPTERNFAWVWKIVGFAIVWGTLRVISSSGSAQPPAPDLYSPPSSYSSADIQTSPSEYQPDNDVEATELTGERARIKLMESEIGNLDMTLDMRKNEIESMESRLRLMEGGYGSDPDPSYETLRQSYNFEVDSYNNMVQRRRSSYQDYSTSLGTFNSHVDSYNSGRR